MLRLALVIVALAAMTLGLFLWKWAREFRAWRRPEGLKTAEWVGACPACGLAPSEHLLRTLATASFTPNDLLATLDLHDWKEAARFQQGWMPCALLLWCPARATASLLVADEPAEMQGLVWSRREALNPDEGARAWASASIATQIVLPLLP